MLQIRVKSKYSGHFKIQAKAEYNVFWSKHHGGSLHFNSLWEILLYNKIFDLLLVSLMHRSNVINFIAFVYLEVLLFVSPVCVRGLLISVPRVW